MSTDSVIERLGAGIEGFLPYLMNPPRMHSLLLTTLVNSGDITCPQIDQTYINTIAHSLMIE